MVKAAVAAGTLALAFLLLAVPTVTTPPPPQATGGCTPGGNDPSNPMLVSYPAPAAGAERLGPPSTRPWNDHGGKAGSQPIAIAAGDTMRALGFDGVIGGYRPGAIDQDGHPAGRALDFMVDEYPPGQQKTVGDWITRWFIAHADEYNVGYIIWRQIHYYPTANGWVADPMDDRGNPTANHYDHPHVDFNGNAADNPAPAPVAAAPAPPVNCPPGGYTGGPPDVGYDDARVGQPVGYGSNTTGGYGGEIRWVPNEWTLEQAVSTPGPAWVRFAASGTYNIGTTDVASNITIDGRGADVTITGGGLHLDGVSNVIISDVRFADGSGSGHGDGDAIQVINDTRDVWINHTELTGYGDGLVDITEGATDVTMSYVHFHDHDKVTLIGVPNDNVGGEPRARVTIHHSLFENTGQRQPRTRKADVHLFNNVLVDADHYGVWAGHGSRILAEGMIFRGSNAPKIQLTEGSSFQSVGNVGVPEGGEAFVPPYAAAVQPAGPQLEAHIRAVVGPR